MAEKKGPNWQRVTNKKKPKKPMGFGKKDVAKSKKYGYGTRDFPENILMHNKYMKQFDKWLVEKFGEKFVHGIKKTKNNKRGGKIMQGYKAGGKV